MVQKCQLRSCSKVSAHSYHLHLLTIIFCSIGIALLTSLTLESPIAKSSVQITLTQQPQINLASKIDFSSKTAICMMLSQPDGVMTQRITRKVDIPEAKKEKALRNELVMRYKISGITHVLNQKNNDMCNAILQ